MANLMEPVTGLVTPDVAEKVGAAAGESPEHTRAALLGSVPTLFAALAQSASTPQGASVVYGAVTRAAGKRGLVETREGGTQGLLFNLFGGRTESITDELAHSAGVRRTSAAGVLGLMAPLVLALIGKETVSRGLNACGVTEVLFGHKKAVLDDPNTPSGLAHALGLESLSEIGGPTAAVCGPTASVVDSAVETVPEAPGPSVDIRGKERDNEADRGRAALLGSRSPRTLRRALFPAALLLVLAIVGLSGALKGPGRAPPLDRDNPTLRQGTDVITGALPPNGRLSFEDGSTKLTGGSERTVTELAKFLVANPSLKTRIDGFADHGQAAGDALSSARAEAVKGMLVADGVDPSRVETAGMGGDPRVESADPDEPRGAEIKLFRP